MTIEKRTDTSSALRTPLIILISITLGILSRGLLDLNLWSILPLFGLSFLIYSGVSWFIRKSSSRLRFSRVHYIWLSILFFNSGVLSSLINSADYPSKSPHYLNQCQGRIIDVLQKNSGELLTLEISEPRSKVTVLTSNSSFKRGDVILIDYPLSPLDPELSLKSSEKSKNGNVPDKTFYYSTLIRKGILYSGKVNTKNLKRLGSQWSLKCFALDIRDRLEIGIEKTGLKRSTKNFLITLLLGDKMYLDPGLRESFSDVGVSHVLAVSGLHTGIIASILLSLFYPLTILNRRKWKFFLSLLLIWSFVFITGLAPSTVRAAIMVSFIFVGNMTERKNNPGVSLCWAAIVILIFSPSSLYDPGFQLSFLCVAGLITFCERLNPIELGTHSRLRKVMTAILTTLISTICTWIIVAYYFGSVPTMFLPANLLILPVIPVYILISFIYFICCLIGIDFSFGALLLDKTFELTELLCRSLSIDGSTVIHIRPSGLSVLIWLAGLILLGISLHYKDRRAVSGLLGTVCLIASLIII